MPATNELLQEGRYRISQPSTESPNLFEAYDTVRNTTVIVREIPVRLNKVMTMSQQESLRVAFSNQAKALTTVRHESLPSVQDYFSDIDRQYLVMESIEGQNLKSMLKSNARPFAIDDVSAWADSILDALDYLHNLRPSIIHRNVRPENLKLDAAGKIKLLGVGVESEAQSNDDLRYSPMEQIWPGLDAASQKVITNSYDERSERILKEPLDGRSDIYSLGATLYYLATGCEPVDPLERSIEILEGKLDPLREPTKVNENIPAEISDVLMKALEIKRENRYDSAMIMRQVLKTAIAKVRDRDEEEAREQAEAAEFIRMAAEAKLTQPAEAPRAPQTPPPTVEAPSFARVESTPLINEPAEVQALADNAEPAELESANLPIDGDVLDLPEPAEVVAYKDGESIDEAELAAVLQEIEEAESRAAGATPELEEAVKPAAPTSVEPARIEPVIEEDDIQEIVVEPETETAIPVVTETITDDSELDDLFSEPGRSGFSLPMPAIAGAIGLVAMIVAGIWYSMSGPAEQPKAAQVQVAQPAPAEPSPTVETLGTSDTSTSQPNTTGASSELSTDQQTAAVKANQPKPKKADPAKTEKKKAVTVDDLINDN